MKLLNLKTEAIMLMLEGDKSIIDIAYELDLPYEIVLDYINKIYEAGLIKNKKMINKYFFGQGPHIKKVFDWTKKNKISLFLLLH